eukprot:TRINITY_DN5026_c0_g1_i1.p1 TRINITY_DN5026_c0_g1~~TRINITY_DN5026_c0_g1_i1.p1  ORF type:complete len:666 (+),score=238.55 TRINITY_DN5026_c0_g1_i1:277-2274(+)
MSTNADQVAINTIRALSIDQVQAANSGHPGAPMGCAPIAYTLFTKVMSFNPKQPDWINRDRFVLSNGHASALLYSILHLSGYDLSMDELKNFRQLHSLTPGHPERDLTPGVEVTTGPLGQGIANAVGLAIGSRNLAANFNQEDMELINNNVYVLCGDGCLQEGISSEASSLAGHLGLGNLIVLYDDNQITIDGSTDVSFTEDVLKRYEAYGWHTSYVEDGDNDVEGILSAIEAAKAVTDKPSLIKVNTTIGYLSSKQGTEGVHGSPLGAEEVAAVKAKMGMDPEQSFAVDDSVYTTFNEAIAANSGYDKWVESFAQFAEKYPDLAKDLQRRIDGELPEGLIDSLPRYTPEDAAVATRKTSGKALNALNDSLSELIGGSADLTGSNVTALKNGPGDFQKGNNAGNYIRFGVREHAMAAICNGLAAYGAFIPFGATFLNFIGYAQGAARLSALSHLRVIYIMTHDSIGLGEDAQTHQPIETLSSWRATPNMNVFRPADGNEVSGSYAQAVQTATTPSIIALTRQNVPNLEGSSVEAVAQGGYALNEVENPDVVLVATGSEVSLIVDAAAELGNARVVSMPCMDIFEARSDEEKRALFPDGVPVVSVEAASGVGWSAFSHKHIGMSTFGKSGPGEQLMEYFGFTVDNVVSTAKELIAAGDAPKLSLKW